MTRQVFTNAKLILDNEVIDGSLVIDNGQITDLLEGRLAVSSAYDCGGAYIAAGLIELHTDNMERHIAPRPEVQWPMDQAVLAHDAELASCGITTVFDAIRIGSIYQNQASKKTTARRFADTILNLRENNILKISHFTHLRAEICSNNLNKEFRIFNKCDRVGIVSIMDHTPGQRQWRDIEKWRSFTMARNSISNSSLNAHFKNLINIKSEYGIVNEQRIISEAARLGAVLASHDDTTKEHVQVAANHGIRIAEFPTTFEASTSCRANNIAIMLGAPNFIRGSSHSGNVSATVLAEKNLLDILSSDYIPAALLSAAVKLGDLWGDLARGLKTVTSAPAAAAGLKDRGALRKGLCADFILFDRVGSNIVLRGTWCKGVRIS